MTGDPAKYVVRRPAGQVEVTHQIEHIRRTIIDPKVITVQPARLLPNKAPVLKPEPKPDMGGLYE